MNRLQARDLAHPEILSGVIAEDVDRLSRKDVDLACSIDQLVVRDREADVTRLVKEDLDGDLTPRDPTGLQWVPVFGPEPCRSTRLREDARNYCQG